ncbi:MAG: hypothetical protein JXQ85_09100 [Cognatishimia sp.]|uniref:hypothetical protein n=1 Tax=Cognatishimia sp. TaxID=2211648 RepID=UPI003B8C3DDA
MIGLMNGMAHGHAHRPFPHPVISRFDTNENGKLDFDDLAGTKFGAKLADKFGTPDAKASGSQTTIQYSSFSASFQSGPDGFSLSVSIVQATISIGALDAANGDEVPDVIDGEAAPVEDVPDLVVEESEDDGTVVSEGTASALYEKAAAGEAALELLEDITESEEEDLLI